MGGGVIFHGIAICVTIMQVCAFISVAEAMRSSYLLPRRLVVSGYALMGLNLVVLCARMVAGSLI